MENLDKEKWDQFIIENSGLFLQSWEWGEFQESLGRKIWRLGDGKNWQALVIKYDLPMRKNYLYCSAGPIMNEKSQIKIKNFVGEIKKIAEQEKSIFLKIEPFWEDGNEILKRVQDDIGNRFQKSDGGQRVLKTLVLDLDKSEEELLAGMKQKTRYNIKLSQKQGVLVKIITNYQLPVTKNYLSEFLKLVKITAARDKIRMHPENYYRKMFEAIPENIIKLYVAEFDGKVIAANIVVFFGNRAIYLHGASANEHRNLMAPYLLQWEQIKEAKKLGCAIYDFWGIDEQKWSGVTRFKKGFGGQEVDYIGTYDYVFRSTLYKIYKCSKWLALLFQKDFKFLKNLRKFFKLFALWFFVSFVLVQLLFLLTFYIVEKATPPPGAISFKYYNCDNSKQETISTGKGEVNARSGISGCKKRSDENRRKEISEQIKIKIDEIERLSNFFRQFPGFLENFRFYVKATNQSVSYWHITEPLKDFTLNAYVGCSIGDQKAIFAYGSGIIDPGRIKYFDLIKKMENVESFFMQCGIVDTEKKEINFIMAPSASLMVEVEEKYYLEFIPDNRSYWYTFFGLSVILGIIGGILYKVRKSLKKL